MLPELKFRVVFPGFGSIELEGECIGNENTFHEVIIKFIPSETCEDQSGMLVKLRRNGNCYTKELETITIEEPFDGIGIA